MFKFTLKQLKSCACNNNKDVKNYEQMPYLPNQEQSEYINSKKEYLKQKFSSTTSVDQYKQTLKKQVACLNLKAPLDYDFDDNLDNNMTENIGCGEPKFHSTQLDIIENTADIINGMPLLVESPERCRTNDMISANNTFATPQKQAVSSAFSNLGYLSPEYEITCPKRQRSPLQKLNYEDYESIREDQPTYEDIQSSNNQISDDDIYICCLSYKAQKSNELSIEFTDRLRILNDVDYEYWLVKNIATSNIGFVPRDCITRLDIFLNDLKQLKMN